MDITNDASLQFAIEDTKETAQKNELYCSSLVNDILNEDSRFPHRRRALSFVKIPERKSNKHGYNRNEIRQISSSMPSDSERRVPYLHQLYQEPDIELYRVRCFEINPKGKIVNLQESVRSKSTNNIVSKCESCPVSNSILLFRESVLSAYAHFKVKILGCSNVGKTALAQQFITSKYLGGFSTSTGK